MVNNSSILKIGALGVIVGLFVIGFFALTHNDNFMEGTKEVVNKIFKHAPLQNVTDKNHDSFTNQEGMKVIRGHNFETIIQPDGHANTKIYSTSIYFDEYVDMYDDGDDLILSVNGKRVKIVLSAVEDSKGKAEKTKTKLGDLKKEDSNVKYQKIIQKSTEENKIHFYWEIEGLSQSKRNNLESYEIEVIPLDPEINLKKTHYGFEYEGMIIDLKDLMLVSNYSLESSDGNKFKIKDDPAKGTSIKNEKVVFDPTTYASSKDTSILGSSSSYYDNVYGSDDECKFDGLATGDRCLLYIPYSDYIPTNSFLTSATLYVYFSTGSTSDTKYIYPILKDWNEGAGNGNNNDAGYNGTTWLERWYGDNANDGCSGDSDPDWCASGLQSGTDYNSTAIYSWSSECSATGYCGIDLTSYVNKTAVQKTQTDYGWLFLASDSTNHEFYSKETSYEDRKPYISISWFYPVPEFTYHSPLNNVTYQQSDSIFLNYTFDIGSVNAYSNITAPMFVVFNTTDAWEDVDYPNNIYSWVETVLNATTTPVEAPSVNWNYTYTSVPEGVYVVDACAEVYFGETGTNVYFLCDYPDIIYEYIYVDQTPPSFSFEDPTPADSGSVEGSSQTINISVSDSLTPISACTLEWEGVNESMTLSGAYCYKEKTGLSLGTTYDYKINVNDSANNMNSSALRDFTVTDLTDPIVTIVHPTEGQDFTSGTDISLNFTYTEDFGDSCWYTVDSGATNTSIASCENTTLTVSDGEISLTLYMNDTSGNEGSDTVSFTVDSTAPVVEIVYPVNGSSYTSSISELNYTLTELNPNQCWYSTDNGATNTSTAPATTYDRFSTNFRGVEDNYVSRTLPPTNALPPDSDTEFASGDYDDIAYNDGNMVSGVPQDVDGYHMFQFYITSSYNYKSLVLFWNGDQNDVASQQKVYFYAWNYSSTQWVDLTSYGCPVYDTFNEVDRTCTITSGNSDFIDTDGEVAFLVYAHVTGASGSSQSLFSDYVSLTATPSGCYNITGLSADQGWNNWTVWVNDTAGLVGSYTSTFFVDSQPPSLSILYPASDDNWYYSHIGVNYSVSDIQLDSCWYNINGGSNTTLAGCANISGVTWNQGQNNVTIYANDTAGNINSSVRRFYIDTIYPQIDWGSGVAENGTTLAQSNIFMNVTYTEANLQKFDYFWALAPTACTSGTSFPTATSYFNKTGLADGTYNYCVRAQDYGGLQNTTSQRTITIDGNAPAVSITSPASNGLYYGSSDVNISWTASDVFIGSCWWTRDAGATNTSRTCNSTLTGEVWTEGSNTVTFYANDTAGNVGSATRQFYVDTIAPSFTFGTGVWTYLDGEQIERPYNFLNINVTCSEETGYHTIHWYNSTGWVLSANSSDYTSDCSFVWGITEIDPEGWFYYNVTGYDGAGNYNFSETRSVLYDNSTPVITIDSPASNGLWFDVNTTDITFTATDNTRDSCWYSLDGAENQSRDCDTDFTTETWSEGAHTITIWVNDSTGDEVSATRTWNTDSIDPVVSISYPASDDNWYTAHIGVNYSVTESNLGSCWYNINGGSNTTLAGCANISGVTWNQGQNNVTIYANDSAGQIGSDAVRFYIDTLYPQISIDTPSNATWTTDTGLDVTYTVTETNMGSCWYNDNGGSNTTLTDCTTDITSPTWSEGTHVITIYTNDTVNQINSTQITFYVDSIAPTVSITTPSSDGLNYSDTGLDIIHNATDANLNTCWYTKNAGATNTTLAGCANITTETWSEGSNTVTIYANDSAGTQSSSTRIFTIDASAPTVTILAPLTNFTDETDLTVDLNVTASDAYTSVNTYWYSLNGGANTTFTPNDTITGIAGQNNLTVYANDSVNNIGSDSTVFYLKFTPNITSWNFTNGSQAYYNETNVTYPEYSNITFTVDTSDQDSGTGNLYVEWFVDGVSKLAGIGEWVFSWLFDTEESEVIVVVNDSEGLQVNRTINLTFTWISPQISITYPEADYYKLSNKPTNITYSITEANPDTCWYSTNGGATNNTMTCGDAVTGLNPSEGSNTWTVWINDSVGQSNSSGVTFIYDSTLPSITFHYPESKSYATNESLPLNFTVSDSYLDSCWWNIDHGTNQSIECNTNTTFNTSVGSHTIYAYANDSSGNVKESTRSFSVNLAPPSVTINAPSDGEWLNTALIQFNYTPSDADGMGDCELWGNWTGTWHLNQTDTEVENDALNTFNVTNGEGIGFIWNIYCEDSSANGEWADPISNRSFSVDYTVPLIDWNVTPSHGSESTATNIYASVTLTEINLQSISYHLYKDGVLDSTTTYYNETLSINWTGLLDGVYEYNVTVVDNATNSNQTTTRNITLDDTAPEIEIIDPEDQYSYNESIPINTTITDNLVGIDTCWFSIWDDSSGVYYYSNQTFDCDYTTVSLPSGDNDYNFEIKVNDTLGNQNDAVQLFGIRTVAPAITLNYPEDASHINYNESIVLNFSVTDSSEDVDTCQLWHDFNGTWLLDQTNNSITESVNINWDALNATEGVHLWNVWCNDTLGNGNFNSVNYSLIIDMTDPVVNITDPANGSSKSLSFYFSYNITDTNIASCSFNFQDVGEETWVFSPNQTLACGSTQKYTTVPAGTYDLYVWATDQSGRQGSDTIRVTASSPTSPVQGGGANPTPTTPKTIIKETATNFTIRAGLGGKLDFVLAKGSVLPRTKYFTVENKGIDPITVTLSCTTDDLNQTEITEESKLINICDYVEFENTEITISPNEAVQQQVMLMLSAPPNSTFGDLYNFNVIASRTIQEDEEVERIQSAKLSVSSRVPVWGMIFKWSYVPLQDEELDKAELKAYPVAPIAVLISFIIFTVIFLVFHRKMALTGFSLGTLLFFVSFGVLLFVL